MKVKNFVKNLDFRIQLVSMGIIVGIFSGLAALALNWGLENVSELLAVRGHRWLFIVMPCIGIILTVIFLRYVVFDHKGHGVPDVIQSVSVKGGYLRLRSSFSKLFASFLTIASGGSAGPEAPVVISGAAIGSNIASYLDTNQKVRIAVTGSGAAGAIAAIFNAPIAGVIFTMEVILGEWTPVNMLPVAIASVTGTVVSRMFHGNQIPFQHLQINVTLADIIASAGLALIIALFAIVFIRLLKFSGHALAKYMTQPLVKALAGGLLVGGCIFLFPAVKGEGYELVRTLISGKFSGGIFFLVVLVLMKIVATSLTLGSGGSGGVFAPSLVIGSLTGVLYYQLIVLLFPGSAFSGPALFALSGMAGTLSGTLGAPLTGIFLILEITGGYDVILPLLLVSFLTYTLVRLVEKHSVYQYELVEKGLLLRPRTDARILTDIPLSELLEKDLVAVCPEMRLSELIPLIKRSGRNYFPVEDSSSGDYMGMVNFNEIKPYIFDSMMARSIIVEEVMNTSLPVLSDCGSLVDILDRFDQSGAWSLPVVKNRRFIGMISKSTLLDHYRKELKAQTEV